MPADNIAEVLIGVGSCGGGGAALLLLTALPPLLLLLAPGAVLLLLLELELLLDFVKEDNRFWAEDFLRMDGRC